MGKKLSIALLIVGTLLIIFICIIVFIQPAIQPGLDLSATGQIGDTIGGIAAPIVGILGAVLVYLSFREQLEANQIQRKALEGEITRANNAKEMDIMLRLFDQLNKSFDQLEYGHKRGQQGLADFTINYTKKGLNRVPEIHYQDSFEYIVLQLATMLSKLYNSNLSPEDEDIIRRIFSYFYIARISDSLDNITDYELKHKGGTKKMYSSLQKEASLLFSDMYEKGQKI